MQESSPELPIYPGWMIAIVVSLAAFMEVLDTTITNVSLTHIAGTLGASQDESTWVLTSYLVANGIILPLSGWLSGVLGRKRFFMMSIAAFTLASFFCGMSTSLGMLIFFRLLQGFAGGGLQPVQQAIIVDAFPPEKRGVAFGITGITMVVAPILGPTLGGYITDNFSWEWIFFMNVPVGILAFILVGRIVQDPPHAKAKGLLSFDGVGLGLVALGLGCLQIVLDKGQQDDWFTSNFIQFFSFLAVIGLVGAVVWLLHRKDPVVDLRLLAKPSFSLSCIMMFFMGACLYGGSTLIPLLVQSEYGYDATTAGMVLSPGGIFVVLLMPLAGRLVNYIPSRYLVALGFGICGFGMWLATNMTPQSNYGTFVGMRIVQVLGLPFLFIPISTIAFMHIPKEKSSNASAIYALSRNVGGSVGIAVITSYVVRHEQVHQNALAAHLSNADPIYRQAFLNRLSETVSHVSTSLLDNHAVMGRFYQELLHQANILAYIDAFNSMGLVMGALAFVAFLMPYNKPHASKKTEEAMVH